MNNTQDNIKVTAVPDEPTDIGLPMLIPITLTERGGATEITVWESLVPLARRTAELYGASLLSDDARRYLLCALTDAMKESGYTPLPEAIEDGAVTYEISDAGRLRTDRCSVSTCAIPRDRIGCYEDLTGYEPNELFRGDGAEDIPSYAVIEDGKLLSLAVVEQLGSDGCAEISVQTAPLHRGKGYASSCICALAEQLLLRGMSVKYVTFESNAPSAAAAEKAGLARSSVCIDAVCLADGE